MRVVVDASVAVKWTLPPERREREDHLDEALALLRGVQEARVEVIQPCHWLAEVAAVASRLYPASALEGVRLLDAMEFSTWDNLEVLETASRLAISLRHHLFDTLYLAVAMDRAATLITADMGFFRKAKHLGFIVPLSSWKLG